LTIDAYHSTTGPLNLREQFHQGRFPRAILARHDMHLTRINVQIHLIDSDNARKSFGNAL
jgi:hypothetical protein